MRSVARWNPFREFAPFALFPEGKPILASSRFGPWQWTMSRHR